MRVLNKLFKVSSVGYCASDFINIRKASWRVAHLRTFKYSVFDEYLTHDPQMTLLKKPNGEFYNIPYDMALMYPLLEICGFEKSKHMQHILCDYRIHSENDHMTNRIEQTMNALEIRDRKNVNSK